MASKTELGGVFNTDIDNQLTGSTFLSTENAVGLIFDTAVVGGLASALGSGEAATAFANGNVVELNTLKDLEAVGLDDTVMKGLPLYHVNNFFSLAGNGKRLFLSFMDSSSDTNFEAVEKMQLASGGILYQIGVWTGTPIAEAAQQGNYTLPSANLLKKLQTQAEVLGGKIGVTNYEGNAPLNILLNAPILNAAICDVTKLPDISELDFPKVSVLLGQVANKDVHDLQLAINTANSGTTAYAVVGNIGAALACLAIAPANESIAHVASFNLAAIGTEAELGFGNLTVADGEWASAVSYTNIKSMGYLKRNTNLHKKGYIFLTNYDNLENSIFFSSDQTLSTKDYRTIARCRVMHKSRRVVRRALLPYVNSSVEVDTATGQLSASAISAFQNIVLGALDANMVEPGTSVPQISGRTCSIDPAQNVLENDKLDITYMLIPLGTASVINVTEGFTTTAG